MTTLPVELAPRQSELRPSRWIVCWPSDDAGHWRESLFGDVALAVAYAAARRGTVMPMAALGPWPEGMR